MKEKEIISTEMIKNKIEEKNKCIFIITRLNTTTKLFKTCARDISSPKTINICDCNHYMMVSSL